MWVLLFSFFFFLKPSVNLFAFSEFLPDAFLGMCDPSEMDELSLQSVAELGVFPQGLFRDVNTCLPQHH